MMLVFFLYIKNNLNIKQLLINLIKFYYSYKKENILLTKTLKQISSVLDVITMSYFIQCLDVTKTKVVVFIKG